MPVTSSGLFQYLRFCTHGTDFNYCCLGTRLACADWGSTMSINVFGNHGTVSYGLRVYVCKGIVHNHLSHPNIQVIALANSRLSSRLNFRFEGETTLSLLFNSTCLPTHRSFRWQSFEKRHRATNYTADYQSLSFIIKQNFDRKPYKVFMKYNQM